jgi:hypothetical protein
MKTDQSIVELAARLDNWFDGNVAVFASQDRPGQTKALLRGVAIVRELDRLKKNGIAAITALLDRPASQAVNDRVGSLIAHSSFPRGSRLRFMMNSWIPTANARFGA